jgi:hypothetical protein
MVQKLCDEILHGQLGFRSLYRNWIVTAIIIIFRAVQQNVGSLLGAMHNLSRASPRKDLQVFSSSWTWNTVITFTVTWGYLQGWAMGCCWETHKSEQGQYVWCVTVGRASHSLAECLRGRWRQHGGPPGLKSSHLDSQPIRRHIWVNNFPLSQMFLNEWKIYLQVNCFIQVNSGRNQ